MVFHDNIGFHLERGLLETKRQLFARPKKLTAWMKVIAVVQYA